MAWMSAKTTLAIVLTFFSLNFQSHAAVQNDHRCNLNDFLDHINLLALPESQEEPADHQLNEFYGIADCSFSRYLPVELAAQARNARSNDTKRLIKTDASPAKQPHTSVGKRIWQNWQLTKASLRNQLDKAIHQSEAWLNRFGSQLENVSQTSTVNQRDPFEAPKKADAYWEYYDACDRWGVEFAFLLQSPGHSRKASGQSTGQLLGQIANSHLNFLHLHLSPAISSDISRISLEWLDSFEFHEVETRAIDFRALESRRIGPCTVAAGQVINFTKSDFAILKLEEVLEIGPKVWSQFATNVAAKLKESKKVNRGGLILARLELARQLEILGHRILLIADLVQPEDFISTN